MNRQTTVISIDPENIDKEKLRYAADVIKGGGLCVIPTETVYGLGANALSDPAVQSIFRAKGRPSDNPLIVHISDIDEVDRLCFDIPENARLLMDSFWPGPLTVVLKARDIIPKVTTGGLDTVGIRMPSSSIAQEIINMAGVPVAAPSANISTRPSPTTATHAIKDMSGRVDCIVDGGVASVGVESTVVGFDGENPIILRPGAVTEDDIKRITGSVSLHQSLLQELDMDMAANAPGMKYKHYSPSATLLLIEGDSASFSRYFWENAGENDYAMCFTEDTSISEDKRIVYGSQVDGDTLATGVFSALRQCDEMNAKNAYCHAPEKTGISFAVYNRLLRAAGFKVVSL